MSEGTEATTNLGEAIRAAAKGKGGARRTGAAAFVRDYMRQHPEKVITARELQLILQARLPRVSQNAAASQLWAMHQRGEIYRSGSEFWLKRRRRAAQAKRANGAAAPAVVPAVVSKSEVKRIAALVGAPAGTETGDEAIDADMKALDEALAALGRIEATVRKYRVIGQQIAAFKSLLGG